MKKWIVRFLSLLVFNIVVLLVIGLLTPARVGWAAFWGGGILTAATLWIRPLIHTAFVKMTAKSGATRTKLGEKVVQGVLVYLVALIIWAIVLLLSGVRAGYNFWGYVLPPLILLIGWAIYAAIDDRVEAHAGALYDRATGKKSADAGATGIPSVPSPAVKSELHDGLTEEQRRMLDELGKS